MWVFLVLLKIICKLNIVHRSFTDNESNVMVEYGELDDIHWYKLSVISLCI